MDPSARRLPLCRQGRCTSGISTPRRLRLSTRPTPVPSPWPINLHLSPQSSTSPAVLLMAHSSSRPCSRGGGDEAEVYPGRLDAPRPYLGVGGWLYNWLGAGRSTGFRSGRTDYTTGSAFLRRWSRRSRPSADRDQRHSEVRCPSRGCCRRLDGLEGDQGA